MNIVQVLQNFFEEYRSPGKRRVNTTVESLCWEKIGSRVSASSPDVRVGFFSTTGLSGEVSLKIGEGEDWLENDSSPKGEGGRLTLEWDRRGGGGLTLEPAFPLPNFEGEVSLKIGQGGKDGSRVSLPPRGEGSL